MNFCEVVLGTLHGQQVRGRGVAKVLANKLDGEPKKVNRSYKAIALTSVLSKWCASCIITIHVSGQFQLSWKKSPGHTGDVRTRGEQVLIQSKPQARQRPSSEIVTEDAHLVVDKRGRTLVRKRTGRFFRFGRTLHTWCAVLCGPTTSGSGLISRVT